MDPRDYCRERVAAPGSSYYYATLFLEPERRTAFDSLFAYGREIEDIPQTCSDPGIARIKLQWWREELARAFEQRQAGHPVTQLICANPAGLTVDCEDLLKLIDGAEAELNHGAFPSYAALQQHALASGGLLWELAGRIAGAAQPQTPAALCSLGAALHLAESVQDLRRDLARGILRLPTDEFAAFGVNAADFQGSAEHPGCARFFNAHVQRLLADLRAAAQTIPADDRQRHIPALIMASILGATLEEILADGCRLFEHRIALTPIRRLWIAWRTRHRETRH
jgi:phytoene synthase